MIGIGGQLLGDMGGFPGNCLKGGFGGVLGALWEVDDEYCRNDRDRFLEAAMTGEPVGAILRDPRAICRRRYGATREYVSRLRGYGHPRLTLQRAV